jgi:alpha-ketoglutarate-dependent 2,4-dichlorophenoxyacetate dioxygenase
MPLTTTPLGAGFVALAHGLDLSRPLPAADVAAVEAAMDRDAVLVFRDQPLSQSGQVEFARQFGPIDLGLARLKKQPGRLEHAELMDISNIEPDGSPAARDSRKIISNIANQLWHSDSSFQHPPVKYSMLSAVTLTAWGGETEFCDLRAACDALPARLRAEVEGRDAEHFALHSRFMLGDDAYSAEQIAMIPAVLWPILRAHPAGRQVLFIGVHAARVAGMSLAEGRMLLMDLLEHATQPRFVYRHEWRVGDLVMWDNRSTLHRGRRYDLSERRELRRTTTVDTALAAQMAA